MPRNDRAPLTRRGWTVVGVVGVSFVLAILFGPRSLNAIIVPGVIAVAIAIWQVNRLDRPGLDRSVPAEGTIGETHQVRVSTATRTNRLGRIYDRVSDGLTATGNDRFVDLDRGLAYELQLRERGRHHLGPTTLMVSDTLGLAEFAFEYRTYDEVLVFPRIFTVRPAGLQRLADLAGVRLRRERHEFEKLREYRPTDSLRDIHWKSSAKRPDVDFIVKEFVNESERGTLLLSGESTSDATDALADALASVSAALVRRGVNVGLDTADGQVGPIEGHDELREVLVTLATLGPGSPDRHRDVHVIASDDDPRDVTITIGDERIRFGDLLESDGTPRTPISEVTVSTPIGPEVAD